MFLARIYPVNLPIKKHTEEPKMLKQSCQFKCAAFKWWYMPKSKIPRQNPWRFALMWLSVDLTTYIVHEQPTLHRNIYILSFGMRITMRCGVAHSGGTAMSRRHPSVPRAHGKCEKTVLHLASSSASEKTMFGLWFYGCGTSACGARDESE